MTSEGYRARIFCIEWHANLWRIYGTPLERCEAMMRHCSENVSADFYGEPRLTSDDPEIERMQAYLDQVFSSPHRGPVSFE